MNETVHILATCRKEELLPAATLVFDTLRVGLPDAYVVLHVNRGPFEGAICEAATGVVDAIVPTTTVHDEWIAGLLRHAGNPFWICDTDIVFWKKFEFAHDGQSALAGVWTPEFFERWTGTRYRERVHTCLMRIDRDLFHEQSVGYLAQFPKMPFRPRIDFIHQQWQAEREGGRNKTFFYDTLAMAYHAFGGQAFTEAQLECFDHINCATYADLIAAAHPETNMRQVHQVFYAQPERLRGMWKSQMEYFKRNQGEVHAL